METESNWKWQMFLSQFLIDNQFKVSVIEILTNLLGFSSSTGDIPTITEDNEQKYWLFVKKLFSSSAKRPHGSHVTQCGPQFLCGVMLTSGLWLHVNPLGKSCLKAEKSVIAFASLIYRRRTGCAKWWTDWRETTSSPPPPPSLQATQTVEAQGAHADFNHRELSWYFTV